MAEKTNDTPQASESQGPIAWKDRSTSYKAKVIVLSLSATFMVIAMVFAVINALPREEGGKTIIIKHTKMSEMLQEARKLKTQGESEAREGKFIEAEETLRKAQDLYITVIDKLKEKGQTVEDIEKGLSYDYIETEYSEMTMKLLTVREMKLRQEQAEKKRFDN